MKKKFYVKFERMSYIFNTQPLFSVYKRGWIFDSLIQNTLTRDEAMKLAENLNKFEVEYN